LGHGFVTDRHVHFEFWAINALAEHLSQTPGLREWLRPRLNPKVRIDGNDLILPGEVRNPVAPDAIRVLAASGGETSAVDIAGALLADPRCGLKTHEDVYRILERAARGNVVSWSIQMPVGPHPERTLRTVFESVGDAVLRSELIASLDELETARGAVAKAAGDAKALDEALDALEQRFTGLTRQSSSQHPGQVYAGRGLVYEDCRRQAEIEIGPEIRAAIAPPLALVLQSARWFSHRIAAGSEAQLDRLYTELEARFAPDPVPLAAMEFLHAPRNDSVAGLVRNAAKELTTRWASILRFEPGARELHLTTAALRGAVSSAFDAPCPGWPGARHHSADILIAPEGPDGLQSGRYLCVLGEVHVNDTMLTRQLMLQAHRRPEDLCDAYKHDVDQPRIFRVTSRQYRGHRKLWDPYFPGDLQLAWEESPPWRPNREVLRIADLVMEKTADGLVVRTRDNAHRFPALVYFERLLWGESLTSFKLLPPAAHTPRIAVDRLVIQREAWRFPCRDLGFIDAKTESDRFIAARRWARAHGLPHWVFARFPQEFKPLYVDLESPPSVEIMTTVARRALEVAGDDAEISLSEMLPNPEQVWLSDVNGEACTSELRIVAVDPTSWKAGRNGIDRQHGTIP
jgi:hypothetical protein